MNEYFLAAIFIGVLLIYHIAMINWYSKNMDVDKRSDPFNSVPDHIKLV
jgi:hypothetical protein